MIRSLLLTGCLVLGAAPTTQAQEAVAHASRSSATVSHQVATTDVQAIAQGLRSPDADVRNKALQDAGHLAAFAPRTPDLNDLVPDLLDVMREDANAMYRIMAAQALVQIGDRNTLRQVSRLGVADPDTRVQRMVRLAVEAKQRPPSHGG